MKKLWFAIRQRHWKKQWHRFGFPMDKFPTWRSDSARLWANDALFARLKENKALQEMHREWEKRFDELNCQIKRRNFSASLSQKEIAEFMKAYDMAYLGLSRSRKCLKFSGKKVREICALFAKIGF